MRRWGGGTLSCPIPISPLNLLPALGYDGRKMHPESQQLGRKWWVMWCALFPLITSLLQIIPLIPLLCSCLESKILRPMLYTGYVVPPSEKPLCGVSSVNKMLTASECCITMKTSFLEASCSHPSMSSFQRRAKTFYLDWVFRLLLKLCMQNFMTSRSKSWE